MTGGIPIPGLASFLSDPSTGTATVVQGLDTVPADERPTISEVNVVHLAWDVMVGLGTLLFLLTLWWWASWIFRRDMPQSRWFLRIASTTGVLAVVTLEAGWTVSEVGRQPWIVYEKMKVEDAATANTGIWITFVAVVLLYLALGVTAILVLRGMSPTVPAGRWVQRVDVPYGPDRAFPRKSRSRRRRPDERPRRGGPAGRPDGVRRVRRRRLRRRLLGPHRGWIRAWSASARR